MSEPLSENNKEPTPAVKPPASAAKPLLPRRGMLGVVVHIVVLLLALAAAALAAYVYLQLDRDSSVQQQAQAHVQALQLAQQKAQQTVAVQQQQLASLQDQIRKLEAQQVYLYDANTGLQRRLQELSHTDRSDWQLAEVEYLLRLAHQRVVSNSNAKLGLELLLSADELLREIDNADLFAVREQIAADSLALRNVRDIDVEGVYLGLSALASQAEVLQFNQTQFDREPQPQPQTPTHSGLSSLWQQLLSLYRITPRDGVATPLYSQQQQQALSQQLLLLIAQAKQALLTDSAALYVASLAEARDLAVRHVLNNAQRQVFIAEIEQFLALEIAPALPDISASHSKMKDYIDSKRLRLLAPPAAAGSGEVAP